MIAKIIAVATILACANAGVYNVQPATSFASSNFGAHGSPAFSSGYATPVASHVYAAPVAPVVAHGYAAPVVGHGYAAPVVAHGYAASPVVARGYANAGHSQDYHAYPKYEFNYGVSDAHTGDEKSQHEVRDGDVVKGQYSLHEADGTIRTVEYTADDHNGFNAVVSRSGHSAHPQVAPARAAVVAAAPVYAASPVAHGGYYHH